MSELFLVIDNTGWSDRKAPSQDLTLQLTLATNFDQNGKYKLLLFSLIGVIAGLSGLNLIVIVIYCLRKCTFNQILDEKAQFRKSKLA